MTEIVTAVQRGSQVYVYGPNQRQLCAVFAGNGPEDGFRGYTSSTVSVRRLKNLIAPITTIATGLAARSVSLNVEYLSCSEVVNLRHSSFPPRVIRIKCLYNSLTFHPVNGETSARILNSFIG